MSQTATLSMDRRSYGSADPMDQAHFNFPPVKMRRKYRSVVPIIQAWKAERQAAPNLYAAITFFEAYEAGDVDSILEICPKLGEMAPALAKRKKRQSGPLLDPLESKDLGSEYLSEDPKGESGKRVEEIEIALCEITLCDSTTTRKVHNLAVKLAQNYTADDVRNWYTGYWLAEDWRCIKNGEKYPTLDIVAEFIGRVRALPPLLPVPAAQPEPPAASSPVPTEPPSVETIDPAAQERIDAICEVTATVYAVSPEAVDNLVDRLERGGFTGDDVRAWHQRWWKVYHWKGKPTSVGGRNEKPTLRDIQDHIGEVRDLPPEDVNRYTDDEYFRRRKDVFDDNDFPPGPQPRPALSSGRGADMWLALMGQLQIQLNRATYDTWLRHLRLVELDTSGSIHRFVATAPNAYAKDWIDKHLLHSMVKTLADLYCKTLTRTVADGVEIELEVEGAAI